MLLQNYFCLITFLSTRIFRSINAIHYYQYGFKANPIADFDFVQFARPHNAYLDNKPSLKKVNINAVRIYKSLPQNIETIFLKNLNTMFCFLL
jgi:hypothetical protein